MSVWFTSDHHFGHANIVHLGDGRPFATIEEHDESLIDRWNATVRPKDTVWHLGDFSLSVAAMEAVVPRLNGTKILVAGNHDACWTNQPRARSVRRAEAMVSRYLAAGFTHVHDSGQARTAVAGRPVMLAHLPMRGDHSDLDRYADRRPDPKGLPLICGHVHQSWKTLGRQVNVGVDQWDFTPISGEQALAAIGIS